MPLFEHFINFSVNSVTLILFYVCQPNWNKFYLILSYLILSYLNFIINLFTQMERYVPILWFEYMLGITLSIHNNEKCYIYELKRSIFRQVYYYPAMLTVFNNNTFASHTIHVMKPFNHDAYVRPNGSKGIWGIEIHILGLEMHTVCLEIKTLGIDIYILRMLQLNTKKLYILFW